eukprot:gene3961-7896_t
MICIKSENTLLQVHRGGVGNANGSVVDTTMHYYLIFALCLLGSSWGLVFNVRSKSSSMRCQSLSSLKARVARNQEEQQKEEAGNNNEDDMIALPFMGLIGSEQGGLFDTPINLFDPTKDTDDLPGADGSDEKIAAIQRRIQERVQELKKAGEWEMSSEEYGRNPLAKIPIYETMLYQIQNCKPFESFGELGLTYSLVISTSVFILVYLLGLKLVLEELITWYVKTDFESDFLSGIIRGAAALRLSF